MALRVAMCEKLPAYWRGLLACVLTTRSFVKNIKLVPKPLHTLSLRELKQPS
jgi:hypothetical protein